MKYTVIKYYGLEDMENEVSEYLNDGWELVGGIAIAFDSEDTICYAQALTKKD